MGRYPIGLFSMTTSRASSGERMLAGGECVVRWLFSGEAAVVGGDDLFGSSSPARGLSPEMGVSSDEAGAHRRTDCANKLNVGERMLAGGGSVVGRLNSGEAAVVGGDDFFWWCSPAGGLSPEMGVSSDEAGAHRRTDCANKLNVGERMLAGGGCVAGGCPPAKPRWSEVMIFFDGVLRREGCCRRWVSAPMRRALIGEQIAPTSSTSVNEC
jgi:hypothetical protein